MKKLFTALLVIFCTCGKAQIISTIAGNGNQGDLGNGGPATSAKLYYPSGVAIDAAGNIYISDTKNSRIQKVTPNGVISNIAGCGLGGDGGPAINASLNSPTCIIVDPHDNIYFSDRNNNRVRRIDTNGIITTVAGTGIAGQSGDGGLATNAQLDSPEGIALDTAGNLFIVNYARNYVRKVDVNGIITSIAGNGGAASSGDGGPATSAGLDYPHGVLADKAGNVYITESHKIRKINTSGIISTISGAGNNCYSYSGNGGPAANAFLCSPWSMAMDGAGNLYFTDPANFIVCKINPAGIITKIAGTGTYGYSGDGVPATSAALSYARGICSDLAGNIYITDNDNNRIRKISTSGIITTIAGTGFPGHTSNEVPATQQELNNLYGILVDNHQNVFVTDYSVIRKIRQDGVTSVIAGNDTCGFAGDGGPAASSEIFQPFGMTKDAVGNIYFSDNNAVVRKIDTSGIITTIAGTPGFQGYSGDGGPATSAKLFNPRGIALDIKGNLYIADYANNVVRRVDTAGIVSTFAGTGTASYGGDGGLATAAYLWSPSGVATDAQGNVYIIDEAFSLIRKVGTNGIINRIAGLPGQQGYSSDGTLAMQAKLNPRGGIVCDALGDVHFTDGNNVRKINSNGILTTVAGHDLTGTTTGFSGDGGAPTAANLYAPSGITFDAMGNLYIVDRSNYRIRKVTPCTSFSITLSVTASSASVCAGDSVHLASTGANAVLWSCNTGCGTTNSIATDVWPNTTTTYYASGFDNTGCVVNDSITVTVKPKPTATYTLQPDVTPQVWDVYVAYSGGTPPYTYSWSWGDGSPNTTTAYPSHTYSTPGTYSICVAITDANGCTSSFCQNDSVYRTSNNVMVQVNVLNGNIGIQNFKEINSEMNIFPNPASNSITVTSTNELGAIYIYNSLGEIVIQTKSKNTTDQIDVSKLPAGFYFIHAKNYNIKFIKE